MRLRLLATAAGAMVTAIVSFTPQPSLAENCKNGICVNGHDEGNIHFIDFHATVAHSHYNFNDGSGQRELGANETQVRISIPPSRPVTLHYGFQACTGGG